MRIYTFTEWCEFIVKVQNSGANIFSTVCDNYTPICFSGQKMARKYRRSTRRWPECEHRPLLLLLCEVFKKKLVNASSRYSYLSPHLNEIIQWKDSIFRFLDDNTKHFNVCWVVWRIVCLDMNILDIIFSCVYNFM